MEEPRSLLDVSKAQQSEKSGFFGKKKPVQTEEQVEFVKIIRDEFSRINTRLDAIETTQQYIGSEKTVKTVPVKTPEQVLFEKPPELNEIYLSISEQVIKMPKGKIQATLEVLAGLGITWVGISPLKAPEPLQEDPETPTSQ